ncbi:hypothetical protein OSTOST_16659 [Ostertagia ostertagi]
MVEYDFDSIFNHPQVMMRDREAVEKKLRIMVEGGKEKLMLQLLKEKFFPVEFDPKLTLEQKVPFMEEWWNSSHNHIVSAKFDRTTVEGFVRKSKIILRDQAEC